MDNQEQIGLRHRRKPGHCWQDNEVHVCYEPIIGAMASHIYSHVTRRCYGTASRFSLRDMAQDTGLSKDTVRRSLLAMEEIGMLQARGGAPGRAAEYDLFDLKELAERQGGRYDRKLASYVLPAEVTASLRERARKVMGRTQSKTVSQRDSFCVEKDTKNGSQTVSRRDATVSPEAKTVSPGGRPYISNTQDIKTTSPLPLPASGKGNGAIASLSPEERTAKAAERVCTECAIADPRISRAVARAIAKYAERERMSAEEVADAMIAGWREYQAVRELLRYDYGPKKFFTHGHWANPRAWPYDRREMAMRSEARIGML